MLRSFGSFAAAVLAMLHAPTAHSQAMSAKDQVSIQRNLNRGQLLYAFDQAAWHATDKMLESARAESRIEELRAGLRGWVVRQVDQGILEVIFFDANEASPNRLYTARMSNGGTSLVSGEFAAKGEAITDSETLRLIRAQQAALKAIDGQAILRCSKAPYNIAVLPPDSPDQPTSVYLLSPQDDLDHVPFGGHLRILVSSANKAEDIHSFTKSCLSLPTKHARDAPEAVVATQLLDPLPTEVDVFTMFAGGLPLYIFTPDERIWRIDAAGGKARVILVPNDKKAK